MGEHGTSAYGEDCVVNGSVRVSDGAYTSFTYIVYWSRRQGAQVAVTICLWVDKWNSGLKLGGAPI